MDETMTLAELLAERERLLQEKDDNNAIAAACKAQIEAAKAKVEAGEPYADPKWFAAVQTRARYAGQRDQQFAHQLAVLRVRIRDLRVAEVAAVEKLVTGDEDVIELLVDGIRAIQLAIDVLRQRRENT